MKTFSNVTIAKNHLGERDTWINIKRFVNNCQKKKVLILAPRKGLGNY